MATSSGDEAQRHLAALAEANEFELEELRRTPVEVKIQQIGSLMQSARLLETDAERERSVAIARERWRQIYAAHGIASDSH